MPIYLASQTSYKMRPPTTVSEARYQLVLARKKRERAEHTIRELKKFIELQGEPVDPIDLSGRNQLVYEQRLAGKSYKELADEFKLSITTIRNVISRIEWNVRKS
jgi:DNA-binding NarL/FixJ family response regulator